MDSHDGEKWRTALHELLTSETFARSPALARLLTYLVEQVLSGEMASLKESVIGHVLYGLPAGYDPKLDSRVRVSANRLRTRLEEHYLAHPELRARIVLPRGAYVPLLEVREDPALSSASRGNVTAPDGEAASLWSETLVSSPKLQVVLVSIIAAAILLSGLLWMLSKRRATPVPEDIGWSVRPFARLGGSQQFGAFSPDGTQLAFTSMPKNHEDKTIYIQAVGSEEAKRIAPGLRPTWSPDGKRLAFLRPEANGKKQVILYDLYTRSETTLTELDGTAPWLCQIPRLSWAPDGTFLYTSAMTGGRTACGIVSINVINRQVRAVMPPQSTTGDLEAAVSPDGSTIAFQRGLEIGITDIFLVSTSGGDVRRVTRDGVDLVGFDWTHDGKSLVVASSREGGTRKLWKIPVDGGPAKLLTDGATLPTFPSVSPDGKQINFTQFHVVAPIWELENGKSIEILDNQSENLGPVLSPDGKTLLYASDRSGAWELWLSPRDGSESRPLMHSKYHTGWARWSPDGSKVVMECRLGHFSHLCVVNSDGSGLHQLTYADSIQIQPTWSRNGKFIYFVCDATGREEIYRIDVSQGTILAVTREGGTRAIESWDGKWLFITRHDSEGLVLLPALGTEQEWRAAEEKSILPELRADRTWDVAKDGVVYLVTGDGGPPHLDMFNIDKHRIERFAALKDLSGSQDLSIRVMPDGKGILYTAASTHSELNMMSSRK